MAFIRGSDPAYWERSPVAVVRLLVMVCVFYAIGAALFLNWPAARKAYQSYFRGFGNAAFEQFLVWPKASIRFLDLNAPDVIKNIRAEAPPLTLPASFPVPQRDKSEVKDTLMLLKNIDPSNPGLGQLRTGSRLHGYWSTVTVLALVLATPWNWKRKSWLLIWCVLLVHVFIAFRLSIYALQGGFAVPNKDFRLVNLNDFWFARLKGLDAVTNDNPTMNFIAPILIWLFVVAMMELWPIAWQKIRTSLIPARSRRDPSTRMDRGGRRSRR